MRCPRARAARGPQARPNLLTSLAVTDPFGTPQVGTTQEHATVKITKTTTVLAAAATVSIIGAPIASAEDVNTTTVGTQAKLVDGNVVQGWTISNLRTSSDEIPYPVAGTLWEATATDEAIEGSATPIVSNLNARARSGQTYRVLFGVATPQGVNPATLAPGQKTTGKVYFDVTGDAPESVLYSTGDQDLLAWVQAAPAPRQGGAQWSPPARSQASPAPAATPAAAAPATTPATPVPAAPGATPAPLAAPAAPGAPLPAAAEAAPGAPLPAGSQGTPLPAGSQGTPLPAGSQGTPLPAGSQGTPATPVTTVPPAPAA
jgi:hypothetical protein